MYHSFFSIFIYVTFYFLLQIKFFFSFLTSSTIAMYMSRMINYHFSRDVDDNNDDYDDIILMTMMVFLTAISSTHNHHHQHSHIFTVSRDIFSVIQNSTPITRQATAKLTQDKIEEILKLNENCD